MIGWPSRLQLILLVEPIVSRDGRLVFFWVRSPSGVGMTQNDPCLRWGLVEWPKVAQNGQSFLPKCQSLAIFQNNGQAYATAAANEDRIRPAGVVCSKRAGYLK